MLAQPATVLIPSLSCAVAAILWGIMWYPLRLLEEYGIPGLWATLLIYLVASVPIIKPCWQLRQHYMLQKINYLFLALAAGWTNLAFILAVLEGEVVRVLLLFYLSPVWAIVLAWLILREKLEQTGLVALLLAITGAVVMLWDPEFFSRPLSLADSYAISAGIAFALTNVLVRRIGDVNWSLKLGSAWLGVLLLSGAGLLIVGTPLPVLNTVSAILVLVTGFPFLFIMTWAAQYGVTHLPIQTSSIIFLLEIIAGALSAAWLTSETVTLAEYIGGILIVIAGLVGVWKKQETLGNAGYS